MNSVKAAVCVCVFVRVHARIGLHTWPRAHKGCACTETGTHVLVSRVSPVKQSCRCVFPQVAVIAVPLTNCEGSSCTFPLGVIVWLKAR